MTLEVDRLVGGDEDEQLPPAAIAASALQRVLVPRRLFYPLPLGQGLHRWACLWAAA